MLQLAANQGMAANSWHTDVTFVDRVPAISILRGVTIPPYGGTTVWANTVAAYEALPLAAQGARRRLWAVHTNDYDYAADARTGGRRTRARRPRPRAVPLDGRTRPSTPWSACTPRPASARCCSATSSSSFVGLNSSESSAVFQLLQNRVTKLENTVRWPWQQGDVAMWDNRATQHYAVADFGNHRREVRRVTVAGDVPVGIDGRESRVWSATPTPTRASTS